MSTGDIDKMLFEEIIRQKEIIIEQQDVQLAKLRSKVQSQANTIQDLRNQLLAAAPPDGRKRVTASAINHPANGPASPPDDTTAEQPLAKKQRTGPRFGNVRPDDGWEEQFCLLKAFREANLRKVPKHSDDPSLSQFYETMRRQYRQYRNDEDCRTTQLSEERVAKLESIGFQLRTDDGWEERYAELRAFYDEHGHFRVSRKTHYQLWGWIKTQRTRYKRYMQRIQNVPNPLPGKPITPEHMAKLQAIGFPWEVQASTYEASWESRFNELVAYKAQHGHTNVSRSDTENLKLGLWCKDQRKKYMEQQRGKPQRGLLNAERIERLNKLDFEWRLKPFFKQDEDHIPHQYELQQQLPVETQAQWQMYNEQDQQRMEWAQRQQQQDTEWYGEESG